MNHTLFSLLMMVLLLPLSLSAQTAAPERYYHLLVGTYTSGESEGIYVYRFDTQTGELSHTFTARNIENPSFLHLSPDSSYVYAVQELHEDEAGEVSAFGFNTSTGVLTPINEQPSKGGDPCYLEVASNRQHLFVGNYSGGNLSVLPLLGDGGLRTPMQTIWHKGSSVNKERQEAPHVHSTVLTPDEDFLFVADLGTDRIYAYAYEPEHYAEPLKEAETPITEVEAGSGPRHLIFDKDGQYAYLTLELTAQVAVFRHQEGKLEHLQTVPMTEPDFTGAVSAAEIRISPDGRYLYASNRGDANEIVVYAIDRQSGLLQFVQRQSTKGETPRNFMIDPTGKYLLVANQNSNTIVLFERDMETGKLRTTDQETKVPNPVYLLMAPAH